MRVLHEGSWFEPISSRSIFENDYERSILRYSSQLFPGYRCVTFNEAVESDFGTSKADLALIDFQYRGWVVVEVELEHHSLSRHVEPQMRRLASGDYGDRHAQAISTAAPDLDFSRLKGMVASSYPEMIVVVPLVAPAWKSTLSNLGVKLAQVRIYIDDRNNRLLTYEGDRPTQRDDSFVTALTKIPHLPRGFRVESTGSLPEQPTIDLVLDGYRTTWRVVKTGRFTALLPNGSLTTDESRRYYVVRDDNGDFILREEG